MKTKWKVDPSHSEVQFKVKHLMITTITGYFTKFDVEIETEDADFEKSTKIEFTADVDSISTNNEQRDGHLKSADFFESEQHGQIRFTGNKFERAGDDYVLHGDLTIKGITKPVNVNVEFGGVVEDSYGQTKAGFTTKGNISRKEFGLTWSGVTDAGNVVVGDDIKILCELQLIKS